MKRIMLVAAVATLSACATQSAERTRYAIADGHAKFEDRVRAAERECAASGGVLVRDRTGERQSIRIGAPRTSGPARYWCGRPGAL